MEILERTPITNRITLRLPNHILEILKKEADQKDLTLNALVTKILNKNIAFEMHVNAVSSITMTHDLFMKMIEKMDESEIVEIAKEGPKVIKKLFKILGLEYDLDHIIYSYFTIVSKYCGWYEFIHKVKHDRYRLVFNVVPESKWTRFVQVYVKTILESLKIRIDEESVNDTVIVFEFDLRRSV